MSKKPFQLTFEHIPPRLVSVKFDGPLDVEGATDAMDRMEAAIGNEPYFLMEVIVENLDGVSAEARRISADRVGRLPGRSIAIVGGSFAQRVVAKLVLTAIVTLGRGKTKAATRIFDDSASAREWLLASAAEWDKEK
jgi:hypothetical protein